MRDIPMTKSDKEWQAEDDMRTLLEAKKIQGDKNRLAAARACAKKKADDLRAIAATKSK